MLVHYICLLVFCLVSIVCGQEGRNETEFERIDAFHALGKCSHSNCEKENKAFTDTIEKSSDLQQRIERCTKCRTKPFQDLNDEEKRILINCIKENDCETSNKFHEKYKETDQFKDLLKCLESKCSDEYKAVIKYKALASSASTNSTNKTMATNDANESTTITSVVKEKEKENLIE